jgi:hypothetical protein
MKQSRKGGYREKGFERFNILFVGLNYRGKSYQRRLFSKPNPSSASPDYPSFSFQLD